MSQDCETATDSFTMDADRVASTSGLELQRALDLIVASLATAALLPLMVMIACAIFICDRGPIFFGHERVGRMGRTFRCWKFRSMVVNSDQVLKDHLERDQDAAVRSVLALIGVPPPPGWEAVQPMKRQADALSEEWVAAYHRDHAQRGQPSATGAAAAR